MVDGPVSEYRARVKSAELLPDSAQELAVEKLQSLHHALKNYKRETGARGWKDRFGLTRRRVDPPPQGVYFFGGVGRGKSMLMDLFYRCAPVTEKRRVHFHAFMKDVQARLKKLRDWRGFEGDPIEKIADDIAGESWLLCFDEFQVLHITDAMILGRLFEAFFERGVVVVTTSNRHPSDLYKDGLQRDRFLPFIDLISKKLDVMQLDGGTDYRLENLRTMDIFITPADSHADDKLEDAFRRLTDGADGKPDAVAVVGRTIEIPRAADGVAFASFRDLCEATLGSGDYLAIAGRYHTMILCHIPKLGPRNRNEAKRFVTLIDALYEARVNLVCSADAPPESLYVEGDGAFEFERTASRLIEMQTEEYMALPHIKIEDEQEDQAGAA